MITVQLNGEDKHIAENICLADAILQWQLTNQPFAVAINDQFIPQNLYSTTLLEPSDQIELLVPMQGG